MAEEILLPGRSGGPSLWLRAWAIAYGPSGGLSGSPQRGCSRVEYGKMLALAMFRNRRAESVAQLPGRPFERIDI